MSDFEKNKQRLLLYIIKYIQKHLIEGAEFNVVKSSFGHDLNAYHYRGFTGINHDIFEQLHAIVPVVLTYWKGDASDLIKWMKDAVETTLSGTLKLPPYSGVNRDLQWSLYYVLNNLKEDRQ